jgi:hypothetical protein
MPEDIGNLYPTQLPDYDDPADIKEALRLYHYGAPSSGSGAYNPSNTNPALINDDSVAGHFKAAFSEITRLDARGYGSRASETVPQNVDDGYVWMDLTTAGAILTVLPTVLYSNGMPTTNLSQGLLWVDKESSPLKMYVYDTLLGWRVIGE